MYLIFSFGFVRSICVHIVLDAITNILGLYLVFVECLHMIGDHKESVGLGLKDQYPNWFRTPITI